MSRAVTILFLAAATLANAQRGGGGRGGQNQGNQARMARLVRARPVKFKELRADKVRPL
jgi:hypothetical protein